MTVSSAKIKDYGEKKQSSDSQVSSTLSLEVGTAAGKIMQPSTHQTNKPVHRVNGAYGFETFSLSCDLAAERPIYLFVSRDQSIALWGQDVELVLLAARDYQSISVDEQAVSFLLQDGVVPPPLSAYEDLYIVSIGISVELSCVHDRIAVRIEERFPFARALEASNSSGATSSTPKGFEPDRFLDLLASAVSHRMPSDSEMTLFHSAGKDSNTIALALAKAGLARNVRSVTYRAPGRNDESAIVSEVCHKLGFQHEILDIAELNRAGEVTELHDFYKHSALPCMDNASLLYPMVGRSIGLDQFVIDGMGSDAFIGHIPPASEQRKAYLAKSLRAFSRVAAPFMGTLKAQSVSKTRAHYCGLSGFSGNELSSFYPFVTDTGFDTDAHWSAFSQQHSGEGYVNFRARMRGGIIDTEKFTRKIRCAAQVYRWDLCLPWANEHVAQYVFGLPNRVLFDRSKHKNKLFIRALLKDELSLDSDKLGKLGFAFDYYDVLKRNRDFVDAQIEDCALWDDAQVRNELDSLWFASEQNGSLNAHSRLRLHRLFLVSVWANNTWVLNDD